MRWACAVGLVVAALAVATPLRADEFGFEPIESVEELLGAPEEASAFAQTSVEGTVQTTRESVVPVQYESLATQPHPHDLDTPTQHRDGDGSFGGWIFTASWVNLTPSIDDTYFALNPAVSSTYPTGTRVNNEFGYQSGFRVGAGYQFLRDRRTLQFNYTSLDADQSRTIAGDFLWATVGRADFASAFESYAGTASSDLDFSFRRVEAFFSQPWRVYDDDIYFRYGLEYASFDLDETQTFVSAANTGSVLQTSSSLGAGPEFGIGIDHALWPIDRWMPGTISLDLVTTASLLIGQSNGHARNVLAGNTLLDVFDQNASRIIPALHARIAFNYELCSEHRQTVFAVGYEFNSYIGALSRIEFPDDVADGLAGTRHDNFDIHGLFASATVAF